MDGAASAMEHWNPQEQLVRSHLGELKLRFTTLHSLQDVDLVGFETVQEAGQSRACVDSVTHNADSRALAVKRMPNRQRKSSRHV